MTRFEPRADLHTHTFLSDGALSPEELVEEAKKADLAAVAITDHDTVAGVERGHKRGREIGVEVVPGVELSSNDGPGESDIHIVGLFIDIDNPTLLEHLHMLRHEREVRLSKILAKLHGLGVHVQEKDVSDLAGSAPPGRVHVAEALVKLGAARTINDAFQRYLSDHGPANVTKAALKPERAVALVLEAKGVPVFAHPGTTNKDDRLLELAGRGLRGLEVFCQYHSPNTMEHYASLAARHGLLVSGGSDFHGDRKENTELGAATVPMRLVEQLRAAALRHQHASSTFDAPAD